MGSQWPVGPSSLHHIATSRLEEVESAITGLPLEVDRMSPGNAVAEFVALQSPDLVVTAGEYGVPVHTRGGLPRDIVMLALPLADGGGRWNGRGFQPELAWVYGPGSEHEGVGLTTSGFAAFALPSLVLDDLGMFGASQLDLDRRVLLVRDGDVVRLRQAASELLDLMRRGLLRSEHAPALTGDLLTQVVDLLAGGRPATRMRPSAARRIVDECLQVSDWIGPRPAPHELAARTRVTDRRVRAAFNEIFGVPATTYFRLRALHGAHRALRSASPHDTSVTDVATRWGFWHLGRFSSEYRRYFGEPPSQTLRREDGR